MSIRIFLPLVVAATLGLSATASFADNQRGRVIIIDQHGSERHEGKQDRHDTRRDTRHETRRDTRREIRRNEREHRAERRERVREHRRNDRRWSQRDDRRHAGPRYYYNARGPEFSRGRHLPRHLRIPQYVVVNPHRHHLSPPPRGHHWVQVGGDYVLVAIASGIIANIIFNR